MFAITLKPVFVLENGIIEQSLCKFRKPKMGSYFGSFPKFTSSMKIAFEALKLDHLMIIYLGEKYYELNNKVSVVGIRSPAFLKPLIF